MAFSLLLHADDEDALPEGAVGKLHVADGGPTLQEHPGTAGSNIQDIEVAGAAILFEFVVADRVDGGPAVGRDVHSAHPSQLPKELGSHEVRRGFRLGASQGGQYEEKEKNDHFFHARRFSKPH